MKIEYGPPGEVGVKSLQYVAGDGLDEGESLTKRVARPLSLLAGGVWLFAMMSGRDELRKNALAVSAAAYAVSVLAR